MSDPINQGLQKKLSQLPDKARQLCSTLGCFKRLRTLKEAIQEYTVRSLTNRILVLQFSWALVVYILFFAALWFTTSLAIERSFKQQGENWIARLDGLGIPISSRNEQKQFNEALGSIARNFPEVMQVRYLDSQGKKVISSYLRKDASLSSFSHIDADLTAKLKSESLFMEKGDRSQIRFLSPIRNKSIQNDGMLDFSLKGQSDEYSKTIGYIDLILDFRPIYTHLKWNLVYASMLIALLLLIATMVGRRLIRWALKPLSSLEEPLNRLANGETDVIVSSSGDQEIARISRALNTTISALKERDANLRHMANHDGLTGLANRKYFVECLEKEVDRIAAEGGSSALFFFDLDRFKLINDTYGHAAGDRLLVQISSQLSQRIRGNDLLARLGGDEFTLLAYNVTQDRARDMAESFIQLMRNFTFYEREDMLKIHFSVGITLINSKDLTCHDLLLEADAAVHEAKTFGRNTYRIFRRNQMDAASTNTGWHQKLQDALQHEKVTHYYQPLLSLKHSGLNMHEALLRLQDDELGIVRPGAFLPSAERFGMMADFDRQMLRKAAEQLAALKNPEMIFSLNLSESFIEQKDVEAFLQQLIEEFGISPKQLIFELPEQMIVRNIEKLKQFIPPLSAAGFRFAVDNFGSGFGSLGYIKQLPVHFLKIDSTLIENIGKDSIDRITVNSIVNIAASLNMQTIAKFVSEKKDIGILTDLGVDFAQGNIVAEPSSKLSSD